MAKSIFKKETNLPIWITNFMWQIPAVSKIICSWITYFTLRSTYLALFIWTEKMCIIYNMLMQQKEYDTYQICNIYSRLFWYIYQTHIDLSQIKSSLLIYMHPDDILDIPHSKRRWIWMKDVHQTKHLASSGLKLPEV